MLLALISFAAGRSVGWHARGYYEEAIGPAKEAARRAAFAEVEQMIEEEMGARQGRTED